MGVTDPDNPYASPPREREGAGDRAAPPPAPAERPPYGQATGDRATVGQAQGGGPWSRPGPQPWGTPGQPESSGQAPAQPQSAQPQSAQPQWGQPTGPPLSGPPPPRQGGRLGVGALVAGVLAVLIGVSIIGGAVFGTVAVVLGVAGRAQARSQGRRPGAAVAGIVLGVLGLLVAGGTWLYVRDDIEEYQGCRRESVSLAQDRACERALRDAIQGR